MTRCWCSSEEQTKFGPQMLFRKELQVHMYSCLGYEMRRQGMTRV